MRLFCKVRDLIFVPKCIYCKRIIDGGYCCSKCMDALPYVTAPLKGGEFYDKCACALYYREPARSAMLRYKFGGKGAYSNEFSRLLYGAILRDLDGDFDAVTWVPISAARLFKRGYDQSELIAKRTAELLGKPCLRLLVKRRNNKTQSSLKGEAARRANVNGAFKAVKTEKIQGKRILLIDDTVTTGATLSECARMLLMAGAKGVSCAAVCSAVRKDKKSG